MGDAIALSLYPPALSAAERAGYNVVADLSSSLGLYTDAKPSPERALGYEPTTPLAIAAAYTALANQGTWVRPVLVRDVRDEEDNLAYRNKAEQRAIIDSRVASLIVQALRTGVHATTSRSQGVTGPVAVVTGESRDVWCVGFTSRLLVVVWIGYDDGREFPLDGAVSALPVWIAFMSRLRDNDYAEGGEARQPAAKRRAVVKQGKK